MTAPHLESPLLARHGFAHGFFLRSVGPDWHEACDQLGVARERLFLVSQVHGRAVEFAVEGEDARAFAKREADAVATRRSGFACGTRVADCVPILLADPSTGAVAAVHSGWRGTVLGVALAAVDVLRQDGAGSSLVAAIGPHIEACCFEVGDEVAEEIAACVPSGAAAIDRRRAKPHVDLRRIIAEQLESVGVTAIDHVPGCTRCDAARFHSFRRDGAASGRMLGAIVARTSTPPSIRG